MLTSPTTDNISSTSAKRLQLSFFQRTGTRAVSTERKKQRRSSQKNNNNFRSVTKDHQQQQHAKMFNKSFESNATSPTLNSSSSSDSIITTLSALLLPPPAFNKENASTTASPTTTLVEEDSCSSSTIRSTTPTQQQQEKKIIIQQPVSEAIPSSTTTTTRLNNGNNHNFITIVTPPPKKVVSFSPSFKALSSTQQQSENLLNTSVHLKIRPHTTPKPLCHSNEERQLKFDALEFTWSLITHSDWYSHYHQLEQYKKIHGNVFVPHDYQDNPTLGRWVHKQKYLYQKYKEDEIKNANKRNDNNTNHKNFNNNKKHSSQRGILKDKNSLRFQGNNNYSNYNKNNSGKKGNTVRMKPGDDNGNGSTRRKSVSFGQLTDERARALERLGFEYNGVNVF